MSLPKHFWRDSLGLYTTGSKEPLNSEERQRRIEQKYWAFSALTSVVTTLIALGAAVAAYAAYLAADSQAKTARAQLEEDQEPSLQLVNLRLTAVNEKGNEDQIQIDPVIRNAGSLPAQNVRWTAKSLYCDYHHVPGGFFPKTAITQDDDSITIAGKTEIAYVLRHQIDLERQKRIRNGTLRAFLFGKLTYNRVFRGNEGQTTQHLLRYCFAFTGLPPRDRVGSADPLTDLYPCGKKTNCVDDACDEDPSALVICKENP